MQSILHGSQLWWVRMKKNHNFGYCGFAWPPWYCTLHVIHNAVMANVHHLMHIWVHWLHLDPWACPACCLGKSTIFKMYTKRGSTQTLGYQSWVEPLSAGLFNWQPWVLSIPLVSSTHRCLVQKQLYEQDWHTRSVAHAHTLLVSVRAGVVPGQDSVLSSHYHVYHW